jgi:C4-dicarboxylate transporter DctQ subunit
MAPDTQADGGALARLNKGFTPLEDAANLLAAFVIMALMVLGAPQIVLRTIFNNPIDGNTDLVELSTASMAFLCMSDPQRLGSHIRMELSIGRLPGRSFWALDALGAALALVIISVLIF